MSLVLITKYVLLKREMIFFKYVIKKTNMFNMFWEQKRKKSQKEVYTLILSLIDRVQQKNMKKNQNMTKKHFC